MPSVILYDIIQIIGGDFTKNRIRELRKTLDLNQTEFGERIGVKQTTIAGYETGAKNPMDAVVNSICREFNVNESWLRTGEGEMFAAVDPDEEFAKMMVEIQVSNDEFIISALKAYWELPEEHKEIVRNLIRKIAGK
ncbi:MAG: helix-turn-helix domain-containing protein [Candidatus Merdivicinus sp.]